MPDSVRDSVEKAKLVICPYCGHMQPLADRCRSCGGLFEPLSRQATHNAMGPWFIRDENRPFQPGCSYETMIRLVERGKITSPSIVRGPTTRQFWTIAKRVPGIAHRLGHCHDCDASVDPGDQGCHACGAPFSVFLDRNFLGLPEYRPMPWEEGVEPTGVEGGVPMNWPTPRPAAPVAGGSISSFATDEEIAAAAPPRGNGHAVPEPASEEVASAADAPSSVGAVDDSLDEITVRSLRRRVANQRQAIQRLRVLIAVLGAITVAALAGWTIVAMSGLAVEPIETSDGTTSPSQADPSETAAEPMPPSVVPTTDDDLSAEDLEPTALPTEAEEDAASTAHDATPGPEPAALEEADLAIYDRAIERLNFSHDESQSLQERIAACQEAVTLLSRLVERMPAESRPDDLDRRLQEAKRHLERLRLREFFP